MDRERRDAERAANRQGSLDARVLLQRLRAGELASARLALAAWVGDPAARDAAAGLALAPPPEDLAEWTLGVARWGQEAFVRAQLAALRAACQRHGDLASRAAAEVLLDALEAWTRDPAAGRAQVLTLLETQLTPNVGQTFAQRRNPSDWVIVGAAQVAARSVRAGWVAAAVVSTRLPPDADPARLSAIRAHFAEHGAVVRWESTPRGYDLHVADCGRLGASGVSKALLPLVDLDPLDLIERLTPVRERASPVLYAARVAGEETVRQSIRDAIAPWALVGPSHASDPAPRPATRTGRSPADLGG